MYITLPPIPSNSFLYCSGQFCKLCDDITNEGLAFNSDKFFGWSKFEITVWYKYTKPFNYFVNRIDIYYYNNPSSGYGLPRIRMSPLRGKDLPLTFINNHKVSQSDDDTIVLSMIVLNQMPYSPVLVFKLNSFTLSDFATQQTFVSEIKFFIDPGNYINVHVSIMTPYFYRTYSFFCCSYCIHVS